LQQIVSTTADGAIRENRKAADGNRTHNFALAKLSFAVKLRPQSRQEDLNLQPSAYEAVAQPLSYVGEARNQN
jgi:hypothetical protein